MKVPFPVCVHALKQSTFVGFSSIVIFQAPSPVFFTYIHKHIHLLFWSLLTDLMVLRAIEFSGLQFRPYITVLIV